MILITENAFLYAILVLPLCKIVLFSTLSFVTFVYMSVSNDIPSIVCLLPLQDISKSWGKVTE